jgi:putative nucleotidyltransferase with HDIG domain
MVSPETEEEAAENMKPTDALETLGIDRAHNLALTFFALNYECPQWPNFEWTPLWRHQIAVAVVMDFFYDALDLKRSGLEYVAGTFHDIGKLILADLFPFAYFTVLNRALSEEMSLAACETAMFGITHAELGANWMKEQEFPQALVDAVARHEMPELLGRRSLLGNALVSANQLVKQIGIGYSGNPALDPNPWPELASTKAMWDSRGSRKYAFDDFTQDILNQFQNFPDLL